ncbi:MAG: hypothetical protein SF123_06015 [Chloroflexota bacterium]|nr:hypothetical protein [Chloroflexota bacterium]
MYPEDRVLVGVINRRRDLATARDQHWYRIPQARLPRGIHAEYIAFFLSSVFKEQNGGIHYFARRKGLELLYRKDLLPEEPDHPRANEAYYKVGLEPLRPKSPPVLNPTRRPISFVYTTWDRFVKASTIADLYSKDDYYVDRIYHALRERGVYSERYWEAEARDTHTPAGVRILCESGVVSATIDRSAGDVFLDSAQPTDAILRQILDRIASSGGTVMLHLPHDI